MSDPMVAQLVEEGVAAAKAGDKALARGKLETAVKMDQNNEQAWFWLAMVVETDDERRTCLGNVIILNPQNERAQKMLDKLEGRAVQKKEASEAVMGMPRRTAAIVGGIVVLLLVLLVILFMVLSGGEEVVVPTIIPTATITLTPDENQTATALASITPSPTATERLIVGSVPTWTPTAGPTDTSTPAPLPTFPTDLGITGRIIMQSGRLANDPDNQIIVIVTLPDTTSRQIVSPENTRGQNPVFAPGGSRFAWAQYATGTRNYALLLQNVGSPATRTINSIFNDEVLLDRPNEPAWSGNSLAFTAQQLGSTTRDLWLLDVGGAEIGATIPLGEDVATPTIIPTLDPSVTPGELSVGSPLQRLTQGEASISDPVFDPSGTVLVYAADQGGTTDLAAMNLNTRQTFAVTRNQNALVESAPDWGVFNGTNEIVFSGEVGGNSDIYLMPADGTAELQVLFDFGPHDIRPRFSPDGRFIVFSSDKNGNWDVFIYVRETQQVYPLVDDPGTFDVASDWIQ